MLWRRTTPPSVIPSAAPVPDAEALRRAALEASWQRSRWVARRRVVWRWLLWAITRYLMPALAIAGVAAWLWLGVLQDIDDPLLQMAQWSGLSSPAVASPPPVPASASTSTPPAVMPVATPAESAAEPDQYSPEGELLDIPLTLRLETRWAAVPAGPMVVVPPDKSPFPDLQPSLKPENWLHSKEP